MSADKSHDMKGADERPFTDHSFGLFLNEDMLMGTKCAKCGATYCPPRALCIKCPSDEMVWEEMPATGKLAAFTCISVPTPSMMAEGYGRDNPYCCGVVEVAPGVRVDARIEGVNVKKPETIAIGMKLKVKYLHKGEGETAETFLAYEPA